MVLPVPKSIKGLNPSLHSVQIASYEKVTPFVQKDHMKISTFTKFGYVS